MCAVGIVGRVQTLSPSRGRLSTRLTTSTVSDSRITMPWEHRHDVNIHGTAFLEISLLLYSSLTMSDVRSIIFVARDSRTDDVQQANSLKDQGNKAFAAKQYDQAISFFSEAIKLDPSNHVLYSNRSAAHAGKKEWSAALQDAEEVRSPTFTCTAFADHLSQCVRVNPQWSKGYARKGAALHGAHRWDDAIAAYQEGIKLEDSPALRKGLKEVQDARGTHTRLPAPITHVR